MKPQIFHISNKDQDQIFKIESLEDIILEIEQYLGGDQNWKWYLENEDELKNSDITPKELVDKTVECIDGKYNFKFEINKKSKNTVVKFIFKAPDSEGKEDNPRKNINLEFNMKSNNEQQKDYNEYNMTEGEKHTIKIEDNCQIILIMEQRKSDNPNWKWFLENENDLNKNNIKPLNLKDKTVECKDGKYNFKFDITDKSITSVAKFSFKDKPDSIATNDNPKKDITLKITYKTYKINEKEKSSIKIEDNCQIILIMEQRENSDPNWKWFLENEDDLNKKNIKPLNLKDKTVECKNGKYNFKFDITDKSITSVAKFSFKDKPDSIATKDNPKKDLTLKIKIKPKEVPQQEIIVRDSYLYEKKEEDNDILLDIDSNQIIVEENKSKSIKIKGKKNEDYSWFIENYNELIDKYIFLNLDED